MGVTRKLTEEEMESFLYWMPLVAEVRLHPLAAVAELDRRRREAMEHPDPKASTHRWTT